MVCFRQPWYFLEMDEAVSEVWDEVLGAGLALVLRLIRGTVVQHRNVLSLMHGKIKILQAIFLILVARVR